MSVPDYRFERITIEQCFLYVKGMLVCYLANIQVILISLYFKRLDVTKNTGPNKQVEFPYTGVTMS